MNDKIVKKIGIKQDTGKYIYADIGVDADKVEINESMNLAEKIIEIDNKIGDIEVGIYELPIASEEVLGGVKIGNGLEISEDGILNCTSSGSTDNTIELSKAEYDALPEDKLTNNITYFIKDMEIPSGSGDGSAIYDGDGNVITSTYAKKSLYDDTTINVGRKDGTMVGGYSVAIGSGNTASGANSFASGSNNTASGAQSCCIGTECQATYNQSYAEGYRTKSYGLSSHAEGVDTEALSEGSHAEGASSKAIAQFSHAEGGSIASGIYSHSEGEGTIAKGKHQHAQGKFNIEDTEEKYAHIVGGGNSTTRKNIHTLDWEGNADFAGEVKCSNVLKTLTECEASTKDTDIASAMALGELKESFKSIILNSAYPIGTVYMSTKNTSPATFLGGTWSAISADKYLKTITSGTGGSTGGSTTSGSTTLTINQIPAHTHETTSAYQGGITWNGANGLQFADTDGVHTNFSSSTGGGQGHTHTINPPYYSVYAWVRTA